MTQVFQYLCCRFTLSVGYTSVLRRCLSAKVIELGMKYSRIIIMDSEGCAGGVGGYVHGLLLPCNRLKDLRKDTRNLNYEPEFELSPS